MAMNANRLMKIITNGTMQTGVFVRSSDRRVRSHEK